MKVLMFLLITLSTSLAKHLISIDETEQLFRKFVRNELSESETKSFQEVSELLHRPEYVTAQLVENSYESRMMGRMTLDCILCRSILGAAFEGVKNGQSFDELGQVLTTLCTTLGIHTYNVCKGSIDLNLPIFEYIINTTPEASPSVYCGFIMQTAANPNVCPFNDTRFEWQVDLPEPATVEAAPVADPRPLTAVIVTDFHIDPLYEAYSVAECDEPTCCRKGQTLAQNYVYNFEIDESIMEKSFVNVSGQVMLDLNKVSKIRDMKSKTRTRFPNARNAKPAGYWGDYRNCDTPLWAFDDAIDRITETHKNIDVVYYIGDSIDHGVWETSYELINDINKYAIDKIRKGFGDDVLVIPVIGNHESQPTNQFAPSSVTGAAINTTWLYEALIKKWDFYLPEEAKATFRERGEFSILVRPGLRVITINNNVAYRYNWWLVYDPLDAKRHLDWLVDELYKAEQAGEKVHILAHIPPGVHDLIYTWTREYNRIVNRFSSTIKAEFNGHTHTDEFKIMYSLTDGSPINIAWGAGSVTSYTFYNLNYKIVTFDGENFEPQSMVNYVYNLTEANLTPNRRPHWFELYDMKNSFQLSDLSAVSMNSLVYRMVTTNKELLDMYSAFFSKLSDSRWPHCNTYCKLDILCKSVVTVLWEREKCTELVNLYNNN